MLPDIEFLNGKEDSKFDGVHRATDDADIYFVCNQTNREEKIEIAFRVAGKQPELWDPVSSEVRDAAAFTEKDGRTILPVTFAPYGSMFVIFRKPAAAATAKENFPALSPVQEIAGPWQVAFDPKWGGPAKAKFETLESWTENSDEGIRNYSGTATYRTKFDVPSQITDLKSQILLDLGDVMNIAQVKLNGKDLGILWSPPFRVNAAGALKSGENELEVEVVNTWFNRVWYEQTKNPAVKFTQTNVKIKPNQQPLPSGLLGPVRLMAEK